MIVFHDDAHRRHDPVQPHLFGGRLLPPAEVALRAERILDALQRAGGFEVRAPAPLPRAALAEVHSPAYLDFIETAHVRWRRATGGGLGDEALPYIRPLPGTAWTEPDNVLAQLGRHSNDLDPILDGTWEAARAAASCAHAAAESVAAGEPAAYALARPPGHHAGPDTFGGYCYLNNTAIAAACLAGDGRRVAVLDIDAHHGNGTQTVFWERPDVLTISIHGDPAEHYPFFLGHRSEVGGGDARGTNLNLPLPTGSGWSPYERALEEALVRAAGFGASSIVVALGVDTHVAHGVLGLDGPDYVRLGEVVASAGLPTVFVQEGGYEPGTLETAVPAVLGGFLSA